MSHQNGNYRINAKQKRLKIKISRRLHGTQKQIHLTHQISYHTQPQPNKIA
jgi:hypothetical protein